MNIELKIPNVGESIQEVQIVRWLKQEGDRVDIDENVVELETDKASLELPSPAAGVIREILKQEGDAVAVGETIAYLDGAPEADSGEDVSTQASPRPGKPEKKAEGAKKEKWRREESNSPSDAAEKRIESAQDSGFLQPTGEKHAASATLPVTPSGRRALLEFGLRAEGIQASGDRIRREDVLRTIEERKARRDQSKATAAPATHKAAEAAGKKPQGEAPDSGALEQVVPMTLIRRRIAARLVEAQQNAALLTTFNEIDMSAVIGLRQEHGERFREKFGVKLGFMSFFVKATIEALKDCPGLNAEIRGTDLVYRNYYDIGVAIGSARGLVVPVLRRAERLSFSEIEEAIADFASRAPANKLTPDELAGGTFTITNGGVFGSLLSTPIVNPPQSGVLGMHAIQERPVARHGQVVIRPMMYVALTYDHRIVDGRDSVVFLQRVKQVIEDPARMLIEA
jgi:2-oxoglutarate dehydrogenase E2 component (dihydrolipoamide succinyltransferase)